MFDILSYKLAHEVKKVKNTKKQKLFLWSLESIPDIMNWNFLWKLLVGVYNKLL